MSRSEGPVSPHNKEAEESLIGACLLDGSAIDKTRKIVGPGDFYSPANRILFTEILHLHSNGQPIDAVTLTERLTETNQLEAIGGPATLMSMQAKTPAISSAGQYAEIVLRHSTSRQIAAIASDAFERSHLQGDPNDLIDEVISALKSAGVRIGELPNDLWVLDEYLDQPNQQRAEWVIPGLIRAGWRAIIVAEEGAGKSVLLRQIAICAAQGVHPLNFSSIPPRRALIIDLENPQDSILDVCNPIRERAMSAATRNYDPSRAWLWWRDGGLNIRNRADRSSLEAVIAHVQPDLVCIGPLYKVYETAGRETDEQAAREVMSIFDDLRTRYRFALMIEHHASKETVGTKRKLMPYGSSLWLRWPEIGIKMFSDSEGFETLRLGRWRGDRLDNDWPDKIVRSDTWPWRGEYGDEPYPQRPPLPEQQSVNDFLEDEIPEEPF